MTPRKLIPAFIVLCLLGACGGTGFRSAPSDIDPSDDPFLNEGQTRGTTIQETLANRRNEEQIVQVNRYIWRASLDVLNFLPIQEVDPYTGVIVTGFGTPPGGGRAYRATVLIQDPALDARSLNLALQSRGGPVSASTVRAVENAILTRARQLRIADARR